MTKEEFVALAAERNYQGFKITRRNGRYAITHPTIRYGQGDYFQGTDYNNPAPDALVLEHARRQLIAAQAGRIATIPPKFKVGDFVRVTGVGATGTMMVERIDIDHTHGNDPHPDACFTEAKLAYHLVDGARPDGSADFRTRANSDWLQLILRSEAR